MTRNIGLPVKEFEPKEKQSVEEKNLDKKMEEIEAKTESEHIKIEEEKMKTLETLEEEEEKLK